MQRDVVQRLGVSTPLQARYVDAGAGNPLGLNTEDTHQRGVQDCRSLSSARETRAVALGRCRSKRYHSPPFLGRLLCLTLHYACGGAGGGGQAARADDAGRRHGIDADDGSGRCVWVGACVRSCITHQGCREAFRGTGRGAASAGFGQAKRACIGHKSSHLPRIVPALSSAKYR